MAKGGGGWQAKIPSQKPGSSPSVENPSGGASVAYFFYSSLLGYFENILVQAFDEGRDSLQRLCLEIFSNRLVLEQKHFE